ncbi:hypothetical protein ACFL17_06290 [Pseudomonadota bacterium]
MPENDQTSDLHPVARYWAEHPEFRVQRSKQQREWWANHKEERRRVSQQASSRWTPELQRSSGLLTHGRQSRVVTTLASTAACTHRVVLEASRRLGIPCPRSSNSYPRGKPIE